MLDLGQICFSKVIRGNFSAGLKNYAFEHYLHLQNFNFTKKSRVLLLVLTSVRLNL